MSAAWDMVPSLVCDCPVNWGMGGRKAAFPSCLHTSFPLFWEEKLKACSCCQERAGVGPDRELGVRDCPWQVTCHLWGCGSPLCPTAPYQHCCQSCREPGHLFPPGIQHCCGWWVHAVSGYDKFSAVLLVLNLGPLPYFYLCFIEGEVFLWCQNTPEFSVWPANSALDWEVSAGNSN